MTDVVVRCRDLGPGPTAEELVRRAAGRPGLVCLRGRFADGFPLVASHPVRELRTFPPETDGLVRIGSCDVPAPVGGGWFGVAGYDVDATWFGYYDHVVRRIGDRWRFEELWTADRAETLDAAFADWQGLLRAGAAGGAERVGAARVATAQVGAARWELPDRDAHLAAVERAIELIRAGEVYQVNVCTELTASPADCLPDDVHARVFADASVALDPAYGVLLPGVACFSPELFWRRRGRELTSSPIKGTRPAGPGNADRLRASTKDTAENVMIVDLVRNDVGRVCQPGSVWPTRLLEVVEHVGVLHLVSTVTGQVRDGVTDSAIHDALFPPASVTGTPKLRATAAIASIERTRRAAYTGAIGFLSPVWGAEFAVAIRTFEDGLRRLGVGGGITVDSVPELEWHECLHKAAPLLAAIDAEIPTGPVVVTPLAAGGVFETVLALDGVPIRLADHLARLARSVGELYDVTLPDDLVARVLASAAEIPVGRAAVRIQVAPDGAVDVTARPVGPPLAATRLVTAQRPPGSWRHKWADRDWTRPDALYLAEDGTVTETERGNIVLLAHDGSLVTPPLRPDLLPGVTRRALLDHARDEGRRAELRTFTRDELCRSVAFWTSSLSGAVPIAAVDGVELPRDDAQVARFADRLIRPGMQK